MSMQRFSKLEQTESWLKEILDGENLRDHEPIDVVQLPPNLGEVTDCEDFDDDILLDQNFTREVWDDKWITVYADK